MFYTSALSPHKRRGWLNPRRAGPVYVGGHSHCPGCGAPELPRRVIDVSGPRPRHRCAFSDLVECSGGCGRPIVRRLPDGAPFNLNLTPHRCPGDDPEAGYLADLEAGIEAGVWPWVERQRRRREAAEQRERDVEAEHYAEWVTYRTARGIPDVGEAEWLPDGEGQP